MNKLFIDDLPLDFDKKSYIAEHLNNNIIRIEFSYSSAFSNAKKLRDFVGLIGQDIGLSAIDLARLILVVDELNNNAIEYGSTQGEINKLRICMSKEDHGYDICIESEDTGHGEKHKTAEQMQELREYREENGYNNHHSIRGRGLFMIITNIVQDLYFKDAQDGGLIVGVKIHLPQEAK